MPAGAVATFYMDQATTITTGVMAVVPNAALGTTPSTNMAFFPRRLFNNTTIWDSRNGVTITDANATGADGAANSASTLAITTGDWIISPFAVALQQTVLPAGTYTVAVSARWKGTGSASLKVGSRGSAVQLTTYTAADQLWHRAVGTFTSNGSTATWPCICSPDTTSAGAWEIDFFNIFPGSSDLGLVGDDGHLYLSKHYSAPSIPSVSNGSILFNDNRQRSGFQLPTPNTLSKFTVVYLASIAQSGTSSTLRPVVASVASYLNFASGPFFLGFPAPQFSGGLNSTPYFDESSPDLYAAQGRGFFCGAQTVTGSEAINYHSGFRLGSGAYTPSPTTQTIQDLWIGMMSGTPYASGLDIHAVAIYARDLTYAEHQQAAAYLAQRAGTKGVTLATFNDRVTIFDGDSHTFGQGDTTGIGAGGWAHRTAAAMSPVTFGADFAHGGNTISSLVARQARLGACIPASKNGKRFVLHCCIGTNDLTGTVGQLTSLISSLQTYIASIRGYGYDKIVLATLPDRTDAILVNGPQRAADAQSFNNTIRSWVNNGTAYSIDGITEIAGTDGAPTAWYPNNSNASNTTNFNADKVHFSAAAHAGGILTAATTGLLSV